MPFKNHLRLYYSKFCYVVDYINVRYQETMFSKIHQFQYLIHNCSFASSHLFDDVSDMQQSLLVHDASVEDSGDGQLPTFHLERYTLQ